MAARRRGLPGRVMLVLACGLLAGCRRGTSDAHRLPTGTALDPAGTSTPLGSMPVSMFFSPDSSRIVAVLSGYREQGVQVIDPRTRSVAQTLVQPSAFIGAAISSHQGTLFVSGGNQDVVYEYRGFGDRATLIDSLALGPPPGTGGGRRYPAGIACSRDGFSLYVAENLGDSLAVIDLASRRVVQRLATGRYPYAIVVRPDHGLYVSAWGASWIASFDNHDGVLAAGPRIEVGRHPSTMLLDTLRHRLYVTCATSDRIVVVDTRGDRVVAALDDRAPGGPAEGSTPNGLALSPDGRRLYVAEADNDAVAVFTLGAATAGIPGAPARDSLIGRIPVEWYPTAVLARGSSLWVLNGKGPGSGPNPRRSQPGRRGEPDPRSYTLGQTSGSLSCIPIPPDLELPALSRRVATANGWDRPVSQPSLPPFRHVVYVIRENRTFDQVFGDLTGADGDSSLTYFPRAVTPNAHALAERFGMFDRFFVNSEVSGDGHNWTTAAYASDYVEKTIPSNYSGRGRSYDYDGLNRNVLPEDDANEPSNGYLWDAAQTARVSLRNFGEFTRRLPDGRWVANKAPLAPCTDPGYPGWDLAYPDTARAARWIEAFRAQAAGDSFPAITILYLPNDHTAGIRAGSPTPRAYVADNDLALGRIVEALTHSKYWASTVMFVLEDDAQDGPDHVDSHRSPLLVISPYNRPGTRHRFANTSDVVAAIGRILHLPALSTFDYFGRPLDVFADQPDTSTYTALMPAVSRTETNRDSTRLAALSRRLDLSREDAADFALFNRILWRALKGEGRPYPARATLPPALAGWR